MLVHFVHVDPLVVASVLVGILTLFGRKKKEEQKPIPPGTPSVSGTGEADGSGPSAPFAEDNALEKLLQSLMQDLPLGRGEGEESPGAPSATPEWVPRRATPPSRPMVVVSNDQGRRLVDAQEAASKPIPPKPMVPSQVPSTAQAKPPEVSTAPPTVQASPSGSGAVSVTPRFEGLADDLSKLEEEVKKKLETPPSERLRPEKTVKEEKRERESEAEVEKVARKVKSFGYVFELTNGALKTPGLVVVSGPLGSGKTTFCSGLADSFLQQGTPCLYVAYDQSPTDTRASFKKVGCDVSKFEAQFRLLIVDGYSTQSEAFSFEPYYVEQPLDLASLQDALVRNVQVFLGEKVAVIVDSLDELISKMSAKDFVKGFRDIIEKLRESGATLVVTASSDKLSKDLSGPLDEMANCVIELEKEGSNGGRLRVRRQSGSEVKAEPQPYEFVSTKGLVFA